MSSGTERKWISDFFRRIGRTPVEQPAPEWGLVGPISVGRNPRPRCNAEVIQRYDFYRELWGSKCVTGALAGTDKCGTHEPRRVRYRSAKSAAVRAAPFEIESSQDRRVLALLGRHRLVDWEPLWMRRVLVPVESGDS